MKSTPISVAPQALVVSNDQFDALRTNLINVLKDDFATNVKSINKQNVAAAKVLGYRNHQAFESFQTKNPWATEKAFILTLTLNNVVSEVILCKSVEEMESRFAMEYIKRGLVAQDADFEEGYAIFDDNYCACMNTAYTSDDKLSPVTGGYIDENAPVKAPISLAKHLSTVISETRSFDSSDRERFQKSANKLLKRLASDLSLEDESFDIVVDKGSDYIISSGKVTLYTSHLEVAIEKNDNAPGYVSFKSVLPAGQGSSAHTNWCSVLDLGSHDILELLKIMTIDKTLGFNRRILVTTHPKNSSNVIVTYDNNKVLVNAFYEDSKEEIEMNNAIKIHLQNDIDCFAT